MKNFVCALLCAIAMIVPASYAQMTTVTATALKIGSSTISTGTVCAIAVDASDNPITVTVGSNGGMWGVGPSCGVVTSGAITAAVGGGTYQLPDQLLAGNPNFYYDFVIKDTSTGNSTSGQSFSLKRVTGVNGSTWALDHFVPVFTVPTTPAFSFNTGKGAPGMACSVPSFYQDNTAPTSPVLYVCGSDKTYHIDEGDGGGSEGPAGPTGPTGATGPAGQGFDYVGTWQPSTVYVPYDVVTYGGQTYEASSTFTSGSTFSATPWNLWAAQGATGPTGATGATGATGPQGPSGGSTNWLGAWSSSTVYAQYDAVSYNGSSYIAVTANTNIIPGTDGTKWQLLAQAGATGATGDTGPQGATGSAGTAATISVGTVTTGAAGTSASVTNSGTSSAAVFNFTIPQGEAGSGGSGTNPTVNGLQFWNGSSWDQATASQIQSVLASDTVNNSSYGYRTGSGGDSTCPTPTVDVDYTCMVGGHLSYSHNGGAYSAAYLEYLDATSSIQTQLSSKANNTAFTSVASGLTPASGGGTTNYLRADGTWAAPTGGSSGPSMIVPRDINYHFAQVNPASNTFSTWGLSTINSSGTFTYVTAPDAAGYPSATQTTGTTASTAVGVIGSTAAIFNNPSFHVTFKLSTASSVDSWIAMCGYCTVGNASIADPSTTSSAPEIGFRHIDSLGGTEATNWTCYIGDGTHAGATSDSGVAVDTSKMQVFDMVYVAGIPEFFINGSRVCSGISTANLPHTSSTAGIESVFENTTTTAVVGSIFNLYFGNN